MALTVALAGDTILGHGVAEELRRPPTPQTLFAVEVRQALAEADLVVLNLGCCISDRGHRWPNPYKTFFFRAPPAAADVDFCHTRLAQGEEWEWIRERFTAACAELGTDVGVRAGRLTVDWR